MNSLFAGNPYAILKNNVVIEIIYFQDLSEEERLARLENYDHDEIISFNEIGQYLEIGQIKENNKFLPPKPTLNFEFNSDTQTWEIKTPPEGDL